MPFDGNESLGGTLGINRLKDGDPALASIGRRTLALLIDLTIVFIMLSVIVPIAKYINVNAYRSLGYGGSEDFFILVTFLFANFFFVAYFTWFHAEGGQTPGKRVMGIRLVSLYSSDVGFTRSLFRSIGYYVSYMVLFGGFIWALFDQNRQTWHDKLAGTIVIEIK